MKTRLFAPTTSFQGLTNFLFPPDDDSPEKKIMVISGIVSLLSISLILILLAVRNTPLVQPVEQFAEETSVVAPVAQKKKQPHTLLVKSTADLLENLQNRDLWDIESEKTVKPVLVANFPHDMKTLDIETRKKAFINTMLPISLIALSEVENEREQLSAIIAKLDTQKDALAFGETVVWPDAVSAGEIELLEQLTEKYRTNSIQDLLDRIDVLPVSLILAQSAIESSWGSSRFAAKGNNLFGVWTWGEKGIVPARRAEGSTHKIAVYDSLLESVRAYLLILNRLPVYAGLRKLRVKSDSSLALADGLLYYSQRRGEYIKDVKRMIKSNELQKFDNVKLSENFKWIPPDSLRLVSLKGEDNAKL